MPRLWADTMDTHRRQVNDAILDATAELIAEHGPLSVAMSAIAERAGIGRATLYKYFPDVESILVAWHARDFADHLARLEALSETPDVSLDDVATFVAAHRTTIATIPMGYADGLPRLVSNRGSVLVRGRRAPIVGNISMDMTMVDVTKIDGAKMGDDVVFLGQQKGPLGQDTITATELAVWAETIPWEILTNISRRVPRFYREA